MARRGSMESSMSMADALNQSIGSDPEAYRKQIALALSARTQKYEEAFEGMQKRMDTEKQELQDQHEADMNDMEETYKQQMDEMMARAEEWAAGQLEQATQMKQEEYMSKLQEERKALQAAQEQRINALIEQHKQAIELLIEKHEQEIREKTTGVAKQASSMHESSKELEIAELKRGFRTQLEQELMKKEQEVERRFNASSGRQSDQEREKFRLLQEKNTKLQRSLTDAKERLKLAEEREGLLRQDLAREAKDKEALLSSRSDQVSSLKQMGKGKVLELERRCLQYEKTLERLQRESDTKESSLREQLDMAQQRHQEEMFELQQKIPSDGRELVPAEDADNRFMVLKTEKQRREQELQKKIFQLEDRVAHLKRVSPFRVQRLTLRVVAIAVCVLLLLGLGLYTMYMIHAYRSWLFHAAKMYSKSLSGQTGGADIRFQYQ